MYVCLDKKIFRNEISGSHDGECKDDSVLGYCTM